MDKEKLQVDKYSLDLNEYYCPTCEHEDITCMRIQRMLHNGLNLEYVLCNDCDGLCEEKSYREE